MTNPYARQIQPGRRFAKPLTEPSHNLVRSRSIGVGQQRSQAVAIHRPEDVRSTQFLAHGILHQRRRAIGASRRRNVDDHQRQAQIEALGALELLFDAPHELRQPQVMERSRLLFRASSSQIERLLPGIEGISFCYLHESDVVRHRLVREIIRAYAEDQNG